MPQKLDDAARKGLAGKLPGWRLAEGRDAIQRTFKFKDFSEAFGFMSGSGGGSANQAPKRPV